MSLESINQDQFEAFVQVLKRRLNELDKELRLPSNKRRIDREIEFDKRLIVQSLNAIQKIKNPGEIRTSLIINNLFGPETPILFAQFQEELEKQHQQTQQEIDAATSEEEPGISAVAPGQMAGGEAGPIEGSIPAAPIKPPETIHEALAPPSQEPKGPIEVHSGAPEIAATQPEEAQDDLKGRPVVLLEQESPVVTIPTPLSTQESIVSQAPFQMPVTEHEILEEEPAAAPGEPGVPWNGTPRVGNIFKGQKLSYQLEKCLSTGKYCEVWKAVVIESNQDELQGTAVALKIANPGLTVEEERQFESEITVLEQFRNYSPEDLIRINGKLLVPEIYEVVRESSDPPQRFYFTQSLAVGRPLDKLVRKKSRLPESDALGIAAQFCGVLQTLHEGLHMSLLGLQPEHIFWDEKNRRIFVIGWKHLSKQRQANFAGDVVFAASELYWMVMGVPAPIPGSHRSLAEPLERWNELSLGVQDILMHALDPFRLYQTANEMRKDLEWLGELWNRSGDELLVQFKYRLNTLPQNEQLFEKEYAPLFENMLWVGGVLEKMAARPKNDMQPWVVEFQNLRNQLNLWQTGAYWLEKGKKSFQARSWDLADQDFRLALKDANHALGAMRWLQVVKAARPKESDQGGLEVDFAQVEEAMNFLQQENFVEAIPLFEQLAAEPARQDFGALAIEARLQENLQRVPGLLERRRYKELAEVYQNAIEWMRKLPQGYQDILKLKVEDFKLKHREYALQYKKIQKLQAQLNQLNAAHKSGFPEYFEKLKELFDHQPGDIELLRQGKEAVFQYLSQGKYAEGRTLAALCLDYGCEADPYLHQVWQYASQLERCWLAWSRGNGPAFRNALLNQAWPSDLWANLVEKIIEKSLELPGEYFVAEFLDGILSSSMISYTNEEIRERLDVEKTRLLSKIEEAFQANEESGTDFLVKLMEEHPYSLALLNEAAAKVEEMLSQYKFSAALKIAKAASTQFSILDLQGDSKRVAQVLNGLRSFLNSAARILPLQNAWLSNGAVGLVKQLELDNPWAADARWNEDEFVSLRNFLTSCLEKLVKDFLDWNLVFTKIDHEDELYQQLVGKHEELKHKFIDDIREHIQADPQSGLENLRDLWLKYLLDPILEQVSLEVLDYEFLFKDEHAQKAYDLFNTISEFPQTLKDRIELSIKNAQDYRTDLDVSEGAPKELPDQTPESEKQDHLAGEKIAFLEAVRLTLFKQALENEDLAALQKGLATIPKDNWTTVEVEALSSLTKIYFQKVQSLVDRTTEALKKGEQIEQLPVGLAAKLKKNLQKQPGLEDTLSDWNGLIDNLRTWIEKTRQAGWSYESFRLESYLEKLTKLYTRIDTLAAQRKNDVNQS